ncbi:glycoside hydrolase family 16 protein [Mycena haematopus]|nr:glycoside hydrolase family 16 protein [Mycena haematopus]
MKGAFWISLASTVSSAFAGTYSRSQHIVGKGFYDAFHFQDIPDPTHGRVNYVSEDTARDKNLTFASDDTFILRADSTSVIRHSSNTGRDSFRIRSNKAYRTHVAVFDIEHMPQGCGTWPAVWETNEWTWPDGGEVDIVEGANDYGTAQAALHTSPGCRMPASRTQTGHSLRLNCDATQNGNLGCGVRIRQATSFGPRFNAAGGGWYAIERTRSFIAVWFWPRNAKNMPDAVKDGSKSVDTETWGIPAAYFTNNHCNLPEIFDAHNIIINLAFCGDWAGNPGKYEAAGCPSTCRKYVDSNPGAFDNAYFQFNSIDIYT